MSKQNIELNEYMDSIEPMVSYAIKDVRENLPFSYQTFLNKVKSLEEESLPGINKKSSGRYESLKGDVVIRLIKDELNLNRVEKPRYSELFGENIGSSEISISVNSNNNNNKLEDKLKLEVSTAREVDLKPKKREISSPKPQEKRDYSVTLRLINRYLPNSNLTEETINYIVENKTDSNKQKSNKFDIPVEVVEFISSKSGNRKNPSQKKILELASTFYHSKKGVEFSSQQESNRENLEEKLFLNFGQLCELKLQRDDLPSFKSSSESSLIDSETYYKITQVLKYSNVKERTLKNAINSRLVQPLTIIYQKGEDNSDKDLNVSEFKTEYPNNSLLIKGSEVLDLESGDVKATTILSRKETIYLIYKKLNEELGISDKSILPFLEASKQHINLTKEQEKQFSDRIQSGDIQALNDFVDANSGLIHKVVNTKLSKVNHLNADDLYQLGISGATRAALKFDPSRGYKFSTYGKTWIEQAIDRSILNLDRTIRKPVHIAKDENKIWTFYNQFIAQNNRAPTDLEISQNTKLSPNKISQIFTIGSLAAISFDTLLEDDEGGDAYDFLPKYDNDDNFTRDFMTERDNNSLADLLGGILDKRELMIINSRFGLNGIDPQTLEEVGGQINLTRERVRQIEANAIKKLKGKVDISEFI